MDNLADEEKEIAFLLFIDVHSETGELGDYDYAKTNCDGTIPPKGSFNCKLALIFPVAPNQVSIRVGEGMAEKASFSPLPPDPSCALSALSRGDERRRADPKAGAPGAAASVQRAHLGFARPLARE